VPADPPRRRFPECTLAILPVTGERDQVSVMQKMLPQATPQSILG